MLLRNNSAPEIELLMSDPKGKFLIFNITNTNYTVVAIYAPSGDTEGKTAGKKAILIQDKKTNQETPAVWLKLNSPRGLYHNVRQT